jgi:two-component system, NtrC family, sensor kinase
VKRIFTISVIFLSATACFSQPGKSPVFTIDHFPPQGTLLDKDWKFHPGDDPAFAEPGLNDSAWEDIDPTRELYYLPQLKKEPIGWFRIRLHLDSNLLHIPLAFQVSQFLATEIYLNGKLIQQYGQVSRDIKKVKAIQPLSAPVGIQFDQADQVLAVRFSVEQSLPYLKNAFPYTTFQFRINDVQHASEFNRLGNKYPILNSIYIGIFLVLTIIHFGLFIIFRRQKANLFFSIATLSGAIADILFVGITYSHDVAYRAYAIIPGWIFLLTLFNLFLYIAVHQLFSQRRNIYFWLIIAFSLLSPIFWFLSDTRSEVWAFFLPFYAGMLEALRISWLAWRRSHRYTGMIVLGIASYIIFFSAFALIYEGFVSDINIGFGYGFTLMDALYMLVVLSVPFSLSLYLATEFAFTSKELESKLQEIERLSAEKQNILTRQNETLEKQVEQRTAALNQSLEELKATQSQLIQAEKMASLGELTAGIAHEIQNPLNFVKNFSEVNQELIDELTKAVAAGDLPETGLLAGNLKTNMEKITHHGRRADAIVKSMLQHSRTSAGQKESADINALADEYLRLSYHGLRGKDKSFNATIETDLDPAVGEIRIVPQDIGRVLLNLFNNALYSVMEKKRQQGDGYEPAVKLTTKRLGARVRISIRDNGLGISQKIIDKIFQPFFTTKPAGQGTGLGLSLSYDIVTKEHNGQVRVDSREGEYAEFIIELPVN